MVFYGAREEMGMILLLVELEVSLMVARLLRMESLLMKMKKASNSVLKARKSSNSTKTAAEPAREMPIGTATKSNPKRENAKPSMELSEKLRPTAN